MSERFNYTYDSVVSGLYGVERKIKVHTNVYGKAITSYILIYSTMNINVLTIASDTVDCRKYSKIIKKLQSRIDEIINLDEGTMSMVCNWLIRIHEAQDRR